METKRGKINNLGITKEDMERGLVEGVGVLSHDQFISAVDVREGGEKTFIVTLSHYINDIEGIKSDEEFKKAVKSAPKREIVITLKSNEIEYVNGRLCSKIPFVSPPEEIIKLLKNLKYVNYKDTGFVTVLIDENCNYLQAPCILAGSFGSFGIPAL